MSFYDDLFQYVDMQKDVKNTPTPRNQYEADVLKYKNNYMKGISSVMPERTSINKFTVPIENKPVDRNMVKATTNQNKLYSNPLDKGIMSGTTDVFQNGFRPNKTTYGA